MKNVFSLLVTVGLAVSAVSAQQVTDFRRPGDTIRVEIKFDGRDADKIAQVSLYLVLPNGSDSKDQVGFNTGFSGPYTAASAPHAFQVEAQIPEGIASGDYMLYVRAQSRTGGTIVQYASGKDFQLPLFHIRNDKTFVPPAITVTERRP